MGQQTRYQPAGNGASDDGQEWLSTLIDTMETVSRHEVRASPCDPRVLSAVKQQLARPTDAKTELAARLVRRPLASEFSLRT